VTRRRRWLRRGLVTVAVLFLLELALRIGGHLYLERMYMRDVQPGAMRVICLGESSTSGLGVPRADSYPMQLQELLRARYHRRIDVVVPVHVGQNTSQVADRVDEYLDEYHPELLVVMVGINNEWALRDSHVGRFLSGSEAGSWSVKMQIALDGVRLFRVTRYLFLRLRSHGDDGNWAAAEKLAALGHPGYAMYPPPREVYGFALRNQDAFARLWRDDVTHIITAAQKKGAHVLLMTYHLPGPRGVGEWIDVAEETHTPLLRNDLSFAALTRSQTVGEYLLADGWHPNQKGYAIIAANVVDAIVKDNLLGLDGAPQRAP
jgi:lysophospholipase L1-like esterase